ARAPRPDSRGPARRKLRPRPALELPRLRPRGAVCRVARVVPSAARPLRRVRVPHPRDGARPPLPPEGRGRARDALGAPAPAAHCPPLDAVSPSGRDAGALAAGPDETAGRGAALVPALGAASPRVTPAIAVPQ